jgi:hypothetical protein
MSEISAANKIKRTYKKHKIRKSSASKIQAFFKKHRKQNSVCHDATIQLTGDNLAMELEKNGEKIPLFKIFNFKPFRLQTSRRQSIIDAVFFSDYCIIFSALSVLRYFTVVARVVMIDGVPTFDIHCKQPGFTDSSTESEHVKATSHIGRMVTHFILPYFYYIVANSGVVFELDTKYDFEFQNPNEIMINPVGIHKDYTLYNCITYVSSPVTTEIAFDTDKIDLEWFTCSPIFRFNTKNKVITLFVNDSYMLHTVPVYEDDETHVNELNTFMEGETMRRSTRDDGADVLVFGEVQKSSGGEELPLSNTSTFFLPASRRRIKKELDRRVMSCFIVEHEESQEEPVTTISIPVSEVMHDYHIDKPVDTIILDEDSVSHIRTRTHVAGFEMIGGRGKTTRRSTRRKKSL